MKRLINLMLLVLLVHVAKAQDYFPENGSVKTKNTTIKAITNSTIYVNPEKVLKNATILFQEGKILKYGKRIKIPENAIIIDGSETFIYPSFIDLNTHFGIDKPKRKSGSTQYHASRTGYYWNDHIRPEQSALEYYKFDFKKAETLLENGIGIVNTHIPDGVIRGTSALITLDLKGNNASQIINDTSAQFLSLDRSVQTNQAYPSSIMGSMALIKQFYIDAEWYQTAESKTTDLAIEAYNKNANLPQIFLAESKDNCLRAAQIANACNIDYILMAGGDEYERLDQIKETNAKFILPVNFPKPFDAEDPYLIKKISLGEMRQWSQKPANPKYFNDKEIPFAFTMSGLKSEKDYLINIKKAILYGLPKTEALRALTTHPAQFINKSHIIGSLEEGHLANFIMASGDIFEDDTVIYEHWINGQPHIIKDRKTPDYRGTYTFEIDKTNFTLDISGTKRSPSAKITSDSITLKNTLKVKENDIYITFKSKDSLNHGYNRVSAALNDGNLEGNLVDTEGNIFQFMGNKLKDFEVLEKNEKEKQTAPYLAKITYPNKAFGFDKLPESQILLIKNATIWTNESEGILNETDLIVKDRKINAIGKNLKVSGAVVIDAKGKHLTPGIIDEHSHIAAASINEAGHNSSAEVSILDVIEDHDINIYRNLSGGVTTIQILHGSANPIGGQSAIIKLKWGEQVEKLKFKDAPKFIKFALGENVKQSNWGGKTRFPQTRMGVEQLYVDYFTRAKNYDKIKKSGAAYRKDIEMEVIAEILNKERFISCHSYVQSEINMLMKVAEKFNFNINTFTHILEGYKVADKMKAHGVGGSTFSDWWAYKYEVNDAIPYNAAIMHNNGVLTAINSDDAEMARRLNQEAAKSIKYGGVSEEDALKFVTLNPAKLLHIDDKVGSIKIGKDADLVIWSDHPLSVYAKAEKTIIEGTVYFDLETHEKLKKANRQEKNILINKMLLEKQGGSATRPVSAKKPHLKHCDFENNEFIYN